MERITSKLIHSILKFCVPQQNNGLETPPPPLQIFHNNFPTQTEIFTENFALILTWTYHSPYLGPPLSMKYSLLIFGIYG